MSTQEPNGTMSRRGKVGKWADVPGRKPPEGFKG